MLGINEFFGLCPLSNIPKTLQNITFWELDLFPSPGEGWETSILLPEQVSPPLTCGQKRSSF
jgi:hypothetical protein